MTQIISFSLRELIKLNERERERAVYIYNNIQFRVYGSRCGLNKANRNIARKLKSMIKKTECGRTFPKVAVKI